MRTLILSMFFQSFFVCLICCEKSSDVKEESQANQNKGAKESIESWDGKSDWKFNLKTIKNRK